MAGSTGTVTISEQSLGIITRIKFDWLTGSSSQTDIVTSSATTGWFNGQVVELATIPDSTAAPTDNYDIAITDSDGIDVLAGAGADRDTANTEYVVASLGYVMSSKLTFAITNAGTEMRGLAYLYIR